MTRSDRFGREILNGLCEPDRILVFVDDGVTPGKPIDLSLVIMRLSAEFAWNQRNIRS